MPKLDVGGTWWLPSNEDKKVPGFLVFDTEKGGTLKLIGALTELENFATPKQTPGGQTIDIDDDVIADAGTFNRIYGEAAGKLYTLEHCFQIYRSGGLFSNTCHQIIQVNRIFDIHFSENEVAGGNCIDIQLHGLTQWVARSGVERTGNINPQNEDPKYSLTVREFPDDRIPLSELGELSLRHHVHLNRDVPSHVIEQRFTLSLECPDVVSADELLEIVSDIQDLVSMGTGQTCAIDQLTLFHPDLAREIPVHPDLAADPSDRPRKYNPPINFLAQWTANPTSKSTTIQAHEMYFTLSDLGDMAGVAKWIPVARKHRATLGRVMATRYQEQMYPSDRYLNRLASLEGFDREENNDKEDLNRRLTRCAELAGEPVKSLVPDVERWIKVLVRDRNDIAHQFGQRQKNERAEWYFLGESVYWLYAIAILRLADAPEAIFTRIANSPSYGFLQSHLAKILRPTP
jgi:hypothetical protein